MGGYAFDVFCVNRWNHFNGSLYQTNQIDCMGNIKNNTKDNTKPACKNHLGLEKDSETKLENSEVNKLVNDATNSIIEKTCLDDIDIKRRKLDETTATNKIQESHDAITNGNTQSKYIHF